MLFDSPGEWDAGGFFAAPARKRRRTVSLALSLVLHSSLAGLLMSGIQFGQAEIVTSAMPRNYSVRWLRLDATDLRPYVPAPKPAPAARQAPGGKAGNKLPPLPVIHPAPGQLDSAFAKTNLPGTTLDSIIAEVTPLAPKPAARVFQPPVLKNRPPANQTLVQLEIPPDLVPLPNVPLPTAVLWSQQNQKLPVAKVAAPPVPLLPRPVRNPPSRPTIDAPNAELVAANLQLAPVLINSQNSLPQLAAVTSPVRTLDNPGDQIPQTALPPSAGRSVPNVVSLPNTPVLAKDAILIPPANQVAPAENGGSSLAPAGGETPERPAQGQSSAGGSVSGTQQGSQGGGQAAASGLKAASGQGPSAGQASSLGQAQPAGEPGVGKDQILASLKRISLPKDGKFGAVVMGSSATGPYTEAQGALSGKILYTVYLRVGLKKNWIMQYGLPRSLEPGAPNAAITRGGTVNLDAPWPFMLVTPHYSSLLDQEYIILRGILSAAGKLEQLKLITPANYGGRDLLVSTLEIWQFRPARKDGADTAVEVLLIIPRQEG